MRKASRNGKGGRHHGKERKRKEDQKRKGKGEERTGRKEGQIKKEDEGRE